MSTEVEDLEALTREAVATQEVEIRPQEFVMEVGNLKVTGTAQGGVVAGHSCLVWLDGKPFPVTALDLHLDVKEVVRIVARIEMLAFAPRAAEHEPNPAETPPCPPS